MGIILGLLIGVVNGKTNWGASEIAVAGLAQWVTLNFCFGKARQKCNAGAGAKGRERMGLVCVREVFVTILQLYS